MKANTNGAEQPRDISSLRRLLEEEWQVEPPVLVRPSWSGHDHDDYHFIMARGAQRSLMVLPECDEVRQFCSDNELVVALPVPERLHRRRRASHKAAARASS